MSLARKASSPDIEVILASASPRRKEYLAKIGLDFQVVPANIDESQQLEEDPLGFVQRISLTKAQTVQAVNPDALIIAADTIVVVADSQGRSQILGKPDNEEDAAQMLSRLSGRAHTVITGVSILCQPKGHEKSFYTETEVSFRQLSEQEIAAYVATGEPFDKAGAYGIQGIGGLLIKSISGSYSNVVGLPMAEVITELLELGVWRPEMLRNAERSK